MRVRRPQFESRWRYSTSACGTSRSAPTRRLLRRSRQTGTLLRGSAALEYGCEVRHGWPIEGPRRAGGLRTA
eukprot:5527145-Prymnesium_polylepis.6